MWSDQETERDFINFTGVAQTVAEMIVQAGDRPVSIGVSGAWGMGKSSMIKLIRHALVSKDENPQSKFIFVEFNAWLYQGYDDAKASLLEVIATTLREEAEKRKSGLEKTAELLKRVDWFRGLKMTAGSAIALALGLPPGGLLAEFFRLGRTVAAGEAGEKDVKDMEGVLEKAATSASGLLKPKPNSSPPKEIHALRKCFEEALDEMGVKLVVLIDDLDRCLPPTTISTLEAIRLFLFLKNTAFVIAADDGMIKHAVRKHFDGINDDNLIVSYFDKLIQVPIRVPPLGTQEVRAYMLLLFTENSGLSEPEREAIRTKVGEQLQQSWKGRRVDRAFMQTLHSNLPAELIARFDTADRLAPIMTTASHIAGNPRLIKRFLNALSIRMSISRAHGVGVDEAVLAKLMLFERCGDAAAYAALIKAINDDEQGRPTILASWEEKANAGEALELETAWDSPFVREWLNVHPRLAAIDLRGALYVSREHAPLITPADRLSSDGAELLTLILENPDMAENLYDRLSHLPRPEITAILDRVLDRARQEQEWGTPPILSAALALTTADPSQGARLSAFLRDRPPSQITASIIPKIGDQPWAPDLFTHWTAAAVSPVVKRAITQRARKQGG